LRFNAVGVKTVETRQYRARFIDYTPTGDWSHIVAVTTND
jgi:hypothetical protein